jgi:hypothetical protein
MANADVLALIAMTTITTLQRPVFRRELAAFFWKLETGNGKLLHQ